MAYAERSSHHHSEVTVAGCAKVERALEVAGITANNERRHPGDMRQLLGRRCGEVIDLLTRVPHRRSRRTRTRSRATRARPRPAACGSARPRSRRAACNPSSATRSPACSRARRPSRSRRRRRRPAGARGHPPLGGFDRYSSLSSGALRTTRLLRREPRACRRHGAFGRYSQFLRGDVLTTRWRVLRREPQARRLHGDARH